jgi:transglutaminase-like putative cysteine protease
MAKPDPRSLWLVGPVGMALLPHALYVPVWVSLLVLLTLAWRLSPLWRKDNRAQKTARILLAGAGMIGVLLQFHTLLGPQAGISLLVMMTALKLLEAEGRRDHMVVTLAGYFLLMAILVHHQQIAAAAWLLLTVVALTASLVINQASTALPAAAALRLGAVLVLQALPLALLLFLLFPRLPSPLSGLVHVTTGRTGLSDSMAPGSVSRLIRSDAVAFRVDFDRPGVDARGFYWRGPVLTDFDGRTWRRGVEFDRLPDYQTAGQPLSYTVTLEPSDLPWLPVSGLVTTPPLARSRVTANLEWLYAGPVNSRLRYSVQAWQDYTLQPTLSAFRRAQALALPEGFNPETVALGRRWAAEVGTPRAVVQRALTYFRQEPFHYTLNPPPLGENGIDDFLFHTRRGFCEHYAGAFTVLMRAAGIPARVVTGYQGGERNPVGGYWIVRQRDAHAWSEVWLAGAGWVRVDPTAAVAPQRVEQGIDAALPMAERPALNLPAAWLRPLQQTWDYVNNGWNQWVLGYDFERQRRLLNALSPMLADLKGMLWAMLAGAGLILAGLALTLFRTPTAKPKTEIERLYARFLSRLAEAGLSRRPEEGPADFAIRAAALRPDLAQRIYAITGLYVELRYGGAAQARIEELRRSLMEFRIKR